jgi:integrase
MALADLSPSAVRAWHAGLAVDRPTTAAKAYRLLSSVLRTALTDEVIARNPCQVKGAAVEKAPERPVVSTAEVEALAEAMPEHLRVAVLLAAWCQLRRGELLGLRRRDIDILRGAVSIVVTRTTTMAGKTVEKEPKTDAGRRTVAIPGNILSVLEDHLAHYVAPEPDALVLPVTSRALGSDGIRPGSAPAAPISACTTFGIPDSPGPQPPARASCRTDAPWRPRESCRCFALPARHRGPRPGAC